MNERIKRLRQQSIDARPYISAERARLLTEFYAEGLADGVSAPVARALAFSYLLEHKQIYIGAGELIVGERGPAPKATPTYPELCCHSIRDLEVLNSRERASFAVTDDVKQIYQTSIIPFWHGNTIRDRVFAAVPVQWRDAFDAGVFTEFMEQRAPGHAILDDKIYRRGFLDLKEDIGVALGGVIALFVALVTHWPRIPAVATTGAVIATLWAAALLLILKYAPRLSDRNRLLLAVVLVPVIVIESDPLTSKDGISAPSAVNVKTFSTLPAVRSSSEISSVTR